MKILEKITLIIYSNIMLILSIILCLLVFGWLDIGLVGDLVKNAIQGEVTGNIILGLSVIFILLTWFIFSHDVFLINKHLKFIHIHVNKNNG